MIDLRKSNFLLIFFLLISVSMQAQIAKQVLVEKYTGAWCGNCPGGSYELSQTLEQYPDEVILVYMHVNDVMEIPAALETIEVLEGGSVPKATVDRVLIEEDVFQRTNECEAPIQSQLDIPAIVAPSIDFSYDVSTRTINGILTASFDASTNGDIRLGYIVVEDQVVGADSYNQSNYENNDPTSPFYQLGQPMIGYVHRHVARDFPLGAFGLEGSISPTVMAGDSFTENFTYVIPEAYDENEISLVLFVSRYEADLGGKEILNAIEVTLTNAVQMVTTDFSVNNTQVFVEDAIQFSSLSTNADQFRWDFGDGNQSDLENPTHTYTEAGVYTVSLTSSNILFTETTTKEAFVTVVNQTTNTNDLLQENILIQPNPSASFFQINFDPALGNKSLTLQVFDSVGRLVSDLKVAPGTPLLHFGDELAKGIHLVVVRSEKGEVVVKKVVKN